MINHKNINQPMRVHCCVIERRQLLLHDVDKKAFEMNHDVSTTSSLIQQLSTNRSYDCCFICPQKSNLKIRFDSKKQMNAISILRSVFISMSSSSKHMKTRTAIAWWCEGWQKKRTREEAEEICSPSVEHYILAPVNHSLLLCRATTTS